MFAADPKILRQIAPHIQRVLIVEPQPASARLLADLMKDMGARSVVAAPKTLRAMDLVGEVEPQIVFTEYAGQDLDGCEFAQRLRRSTSPFRKAPIIMVTAEATATSIKSARDSGVHEFLRKPYTAKDLFRRVENVVLKPRDWIEAKMYVGPDRRRFNDGDYQGPAKREADQSAQPSAERAA